MSELLLLTKLAPPLLPQEMVPRLQLQKKLNEGLLHESCFTRRLTLVSAPAGYGKTSLSINWLSDLNITYAWYSLDEEDNDPKRFLVYLVTALDQVKEKIGSTSLAMLAAPQGPPFESVLTVLINEINTRKEPVVLVLDDYHHIHVPQIHQQLNFLTEHQPDCLHTVILSREDPPLPLSRLRARRQVVEVRQAELRFSQSESTDFLVKVSGIELDQGDIAALNQRTEGWIAGLQLAALSLASQADAHNFIENFTGSNRYVLDYLFEEVFKGQPATVQSFLLETSILNRLTPALCDALTGRSDSREQLERLEKANLFIMPLDPARRWYRYQHLFSDLLLHLLRLSGDPSETELHQRASKWYRQNGQLEEAVRHALAGKDWGKATALILVVDEEFLNRGEIATLLRWFDQLPEETIQSEPSLCLAYAWALMLASKFDEAEKGLEWAETSAAGNKATLGEIAAARAFMAQSLGDGPTLVKMSHKALALLPEDDLNSRGMVAMNLGIAYWHMGKMEQAQEALEEAYPATRDSGNAYGETATRDFLGRVLAVRGQLRQAAGIFEDILDQAGDKPVFPLVYLDMCALHYEWNHLDTASRYLEQYLGASQRGGNIEFQIAGYMQKARLRLAFGDTSGALEALEQIHRLEGRSNLPERTLARSIDLQVHVALRLGDQETVTRLAPHLIGGSEAHNFYRHLGLTPARVKLSQERRAEAAEELEQAAQTARENGWGYGLIAVLILQALAAEDTEAGLIYLKEALDLAMPEGFIQTFNEAGEALVPLLREAAQRGIHTNYIGGILNTFGEADRSAALATATLVEPLSQRELEVLRLVCAGLSNREIAEKLFVSTGTVKTHIHNIYGKLEVGNRTQAATRARELNLV